VINALNKKKAGKKERVDNGCLFMKVQSRTVEKVTFEQRPQTRYKTLNSKKMMRTCHKAKQGEGLPDALWDPNTHKNVVKYIWKE
jgi:hypothetical protein